MKIHILTCRFILPSVPGIKKEGVFINTERRLSKMNPIIAKEEGEKSDFEIFYGIGQALGMGSLLDNWKTQEMYLNY